MAAQKVWIVNGQEYVPSSEMRVVEPAERYYYVQPAPPVQVVEVPQRAVCLQPRVYAPPPAPQVVIYQTSHNTSLVVGAFLALLIMLILGFGAVLLLALVASGRLF
jgi:hypothetical protein